MNVIVTAQGYENKFVLKNENKFESKYETVIITQKESKNDDIKDIVLSDVIVTTNNNGDIHFISDKKTKGMSIFVFVTWAHDKKTLIEIVNKYDGKLLFHTNNEILFVDRKDKEKMDKVKDEGFLFITAY